MPTLEFDDEETSALKQFYARASEQVAQGSQTHLPAVFATIAPLIDSIRPNRPVEIDVDDIRTLAEAFDVGQSLDEKTSARDDGPARRLQGKLMRAAKS
ncbi:hypothetical protein OSJ77_09635 [Phyllobacterium sp. 0TCS1.6C]|uniref:hypothetical protein n=1 Tax=unclassified Phyllobacterium TaxID=2638441 RepID=UPI0022643CB0|nr:MULTISPECIES: hypothetical protein [unclassified Phyllobacterium]MCX8280453.1 hypothetical protein [Phyllobacterium sp. 0TCS1.6C]MCX8295098.1 hypothetical protein [Phyllobacterium sp. 0TCS1.6A]